MSLPFGHELSRCIENDSLHICIISMDNLHSRLNDKNLPDIVHLRSQYLIYNTRNWPAIISLTRMVPTCMVKKRYV